MRKNLCTLEAVFHTPEQKKHFCGYVIGSVTGDKAKVKVFNELFPNKYDQSALNKFIVQAESDERELNSKQVELEMRRLNRRQLIMDDILAHHAYSQMEGLAICMLIALAIWL